MLVLSHADERHTAMLTYHQEGKHEDWQQFTGLFDRKGKEVYEGDIIQGYDFLGEPTEKYTVEYRVNSFSFYTKEQPEAAYYFASGLYEVIGNIYENSDLI